MVENIVSIELSYINTKHPDFQRETAMVGSLMAVNNDDYHKSSRSSSSSLMGKSSKNRHVQLASNQQPLANGDDKENAAPKVKRKPHFRVFQRNSTFSLSKNDISRGT